MINPILFKFALCFAFICALCIVGPCLADNIRNGDYVKESIIVKASPQEVFQFIQHLRNSDNKCRKLVSYHKGKAILEEHFLGLPLVGNATCVYQEVEVPFSRIDYSLISSDKFRNFDGHWYIEPVADSHKTKVELTSCIIDANIRVPFWRDISKLATIRHVRKRLSAIQELANGLHSSQKSKFRLSLK